MPLPAELHRVRIAAKKLRYAAEFLQPGYPSLLPPIADVATGIQDALGEAHDLDAVTQTLLSDLERTGETGDRALDGPAVAHLLRHNAERRDEALIRFRALWSSVPTPGSVRKQLLAAT